MQRFAANAESFFPICSAINSLLHKVLDLKKPWDGDKGSLALAEVQFLMMMMVMMMMRKMRIMMMMMVMMMMMRKMRIMMMMTFLSQTGTCQHGNIKMKIYHVLQEMRFILKKTAEKPLYP